MKAVLFTWGPVHLYRYGTMVALGILAGVCLARREARRRRLDAGAVLDLCLTGAVAGLVGARAEHVLFNLPYYAARPAEILRLSEGGLSVHGALIAGAIVVWWFCRRKKLPFVHVADALAPAVALGEAIGRIGCDVVGKPTSWPLAITLGGVRYHNVPLYSSVYLFGLFAYLWFFRRPRASVPGELTFEFILWYSVGRFVIEFARQSAPVWFGWSLAQLVSAALVVVAVVFLQLLRGRRA